MFEDLLPEGFITEWGDPRDSTPELLPAEAALIDNAVKKRKDEFRKGRQCARAALKRLEIHDFPLLRGQAREPLWPEGIVGSITHTKDLCAVVVATKTRYVAVGIDAEVAQPLTAEVAERVASKSEVSELPGMSELLVACLVFSAKEAFYKCQFCLSQQWLGFFDVSLKLAPDGSFVTELLVDAGPLVRGTKVGGRWSQRNGFFLTATWLPAMPATT